ncbi:MAG TPA: hypothetical protein PKY29_00245 [Ferruginibacter sp.]|nr:hypothetical protein [Ferruginibacter sp.]HRO16672.1 hypothetical protein [Ferruginibacter sp.]HRQ19706.1 hypothetical protein [Ferruginibacter sp.]
MQIIPVQDALSQKWFLQVPKTLYANDPQWIEPLHHEIISVFDPEKNKTFRYGTVQRWVLLINEKPAGRIAAFTNNRYKNKGDDMPVGGMGFFECINHQDAADLLLDNARSWLIAQGMEAMDGPINFGERDKWWGLVTEGFTEPLYGMNYNPPYYKDLLEHYGFKPFFHQICLSMNLKQSIDPKIMKRHALWEKDGRFRAEMIRKNQLEKYAEDFVTVYNKAWAGHGGLKKLSKDQVLIMFRKMKPVMDEKGMWFLYCENEPAGIFVNLPDLNQWFKHLHGKFDVLHKLYFLWLKKTRKNKKLTGLVFGIVPEWQGKGLDAYFIGEAQKVIMSNQVPYEHYEMQWIGDFNPKMLNVAEGLGRVERSRILTTYRCLFDPLKEFKRHPILS